MSFFARDVEAANDQPSTSSAKTEVAKMSVDDAGRYVIDEVN